MKKVIFLILFAMSFHAVAYAETEKALFDNGVLFFKQGKTQQAIDSFSKLIEISPGNADAYKNRGVSYMKQEKFDLAIQDFEKAKELFPELKGLYSNLGVAWYYKKEYEKAIQNYDIELEMAPENHVAYFNRALCLAELGRNAEALEDLSRTLELRPDFYWAVCYKADLLAQKGDIVTAIATYEDAIRIEPDNTYAIEKLALLKPDQKKQDTLGKPNTSPEKSHPTPETSQKTSDGYTIQSGAFLGHENAMKMKKQLADKGLDSRILILKDSRDRTWYLVRSGRYPDPEAARNALPSFKKILKTDSLVRPAGAW